MKVTRRLTQKITCEFYDFDTEKELLKFFESKTSQKTKVIAVNRKKDFLIGSTRFLKKINGFKQIDVWSEDSYYYYDPEWNCYTLCLIRTYY